MREAALREAVAIVAESGVESLSLREVARRLGVSHQTPYRHFPSRDHLLAAIVSGAYRDFADALDARPRRADPAEDLEGMALAYLAYARTHALEYRLMFGTPLPDPAAHPEMMRDARHAFGLLRQALLRLRPEWSETGDLDALFVWANIHGLASTMNSPAMGTLGLSDETLAAAIPHALRRLGQIVESDRPRS